jgi:hypothetical protein
VPYIIGFDLPRGHLSDLGIHCNCSTLSYKRLGQTPLHKGRKKKRLRQVRFEHNTTQFSRGRRVLRSGDPNYVNHRVHRVHLELTTNRLKVFPTKKTTADGSRSDSAGSVVKLLRQSQLRSRNKQNLRPCLFVLLLLSFWISWLMTSWIVRCLILGVGFCNIYLIFLHTKRLKSSSRWVFQLLVHFFISLLFSVLKDSWKIYHLFLLLSSQLFDWKSQLRSMNKQSQSNKVKAPDFRCPTDKIIYIYIYIYIYNIYHILLLPSLESDPGRNLIMDWIINIFITQIQDSIIDFVELYSNPWFKS